MNDPSDWELLARYLSGECSDEEQAEVKALIASDPGKQRLIAGQLAIHIQEQSLEDILELISGLTGLEYQRTEGSVWLSPRDPVRQR